MNSKKQTLLLTGILSFALIVFISSCNKKDEGTGAPVISLQSPADNSMMTTGDTLTITGTITDDEALHEVSVLIIKSTGDTAFQEYPYVHALKTYNLSYRYKPTTAGDYTVKVTAEDHDEKNTTVSRALTVM
jgi:hypothetical protein